MGAISRGRGINFCLCFTHGNNIINHNCSALTIRQKDWGRQTDRQTETDRQASRQTGGQTGGQTSGRRDRRRDRQTGGRRHRRRDRQAESGGVNKLRSRSLKGCLCQSIMGEFCCTGCFCHCIKSRSRVKYQWPLPSWRKVSVPSVRIRLSICYHCQGKIEPLSFHPTRSLTIKKKTLAALNLWRVKHWKVELDLFPKRKKTKTKQDYVHLH